MLDAEETKGWPLNWYQLKSNFKDTWNVYIHIYSSDYHTVFRVRLTHYSAQETECRLHSKYDSARSSVQTRTCQY